ncbi:23S rRNA (cytidine(2498)-2'-O)-methyltransferase RlmM [Alkalisalibacterium limincola]|uniref:23S rRNA (Cytidine(2498)-2'-O)-methyltransferase RlmM n=1 Tax=Alkalisalibacterium limincola TaxID=2699169 RepID=A0A5C8KLS3_9GAMM|nr:23S rRNA (cytidine(2498)-2'-O)-methyltransferase RlmM [Alkalisalibacterium limincola]TXK60551.1 23S rRNA (cytidine(2498)-2'-O)-methyltransferase RlmM [Alkalisalibacterium limincola]
MATPVDHPAATGLLCFCRAGFEPDLAAELGERAAAAGHHGYARTERGSAYVEWLGTPDPRALDRALPCRDLVFARTKLRLLAELPGIDPGDRIAALLPVLARGRWGELWVEHPDADATRPLSGLARAFANALRPALRKAGHLSATTDPRLPRLHVVLLAGDHLLVAEADPTDASPWPLGIPRLRVPAQAPSRSAAKLEEALLTLLDEDERDRWLQPGMRAADLGAAPGGWSWILARRQLRVQAIDNGPMADAAMDTGLIEHLRADGFRWHPSQPIDWMVCDMVEQPIRVASRMAEWFAHGWCRHSIFNLKLPMKKRWQETRRCLDHFGESAGPLKVLRARQLYHDREEITVFASR